MRILVLDKTDKVYKVVFDALSEFCEIEFANSYDIAIENFSSSFNTIKQFSFIFIYVDAFENEAFTFVNKVRKIDIKNNCNIVAIINDELLVKALNSASKVSERFVKAIPNSIEIFEIYESMLRK